MLTKSQMQKTMTDSIGYAQHNNQPNTFENILPCSIDQSFFVCSFSRSQLWKGGDRNCRLYLCGSFL